MKGRVGQFEILERLGEGGIGRVYSAHDTLVDRKVAIKSLRPELLNDKGFVERFVAEAKNLARLAHPNITALYSLIQDAGHIYMIMELAAGRTIEAMLHDRPGGFPPPEALAIAGQAADALAYAHEMGVVHRDIKPANLIVAEAGLVKIMDFGIARAEGSQRMTRDGSLVGTLAYMSPEQCRGQDVDGRSDLYSLGVVLYEMLTGKAPFSARSDYDLMQAQIHQPPEPPSRLAPGIEPHLEAALMKALAKRPDDRFETVSAFKEALGAPFLGTWTLNSMRVATRPISAPVSATLPLAEPQAPGSGVAMATKAKRRSPALGGALAGGSAALILVGVVFAFRPPSELELQQAPKLVATDISPAGTIARVAARQANPNFLPAPPADMGPYPPSPKSTPPALAEVAAEPERAGVRSAPTEKASRVAESRKEAPPVLSQAKAEPPPPAPEARVLSSKDATAAYKARNYAAARQKALPCAEAGEPECEFILGRLFESGEGGEKNAALAADWYGKAAEAGLDKACYNLGVLYYSGQGVPKDLAVAAQWFIKAAYRNYPRAELNLAMLYENGEGVPRDITRARYWYSEAAKSSDPLVAEAAHQSLDQIGGKRRR